MLTSQSETGYLKTVVVKTAADAFIDDAHINDQWQEHNFLGMPVFQRAVQEHALFTEILKHNGTEILYLRPNESVTIDSMYCRDASIATDHGMIVCNMGKAVRAKEPEAQKELFLQQNIPVLGVIQPPGTLEGGDVCWLNAKTLAVAHSYRTNTEGIAQLRHLLAPFEIEIFVCPLPHFNGPSDVFHLMSILSPVADDLAVVYSRLMPIHLRNRLKELGYEFVEVDDTEFGMQACNVLAIAPRKCVIVNGNPITKARLEDAGCVVHQYSGGEISIKGGGGPTCLTRPLARLV